VLFYLVVFHFCLKKLIFIQNVTLYTRYPLNGVAAEVGSMEEVKDNKKVSYHFAIFAIINELLIIRKLYIRVRRIFFRRKQLSPFRESYKENIKIFF